MKITSEGKIIFWAGGDRLNLKTILLSLTGKDPLILEIYKPPVFPIGSDRPLQIFTPARDWAPIKKSTYLEKLSQKNHPDKKATF